MNPSTPRSGKLAAALVALAATAAAPAAQSAEPVPTVLVTGANRGIGLGIVRVYVARGWKVIATARRPDEATELQALAAADPDLKMEALDVTDHAQVDALAAKYRGQPIDVLVNNAGILDRETQRFGSVDYDVFRKVLETNTIAPFKLTEALMPSLRASSQKKVVTVSSGEGSLGMVNSARVYSYRASKAAVNMLMLNLAYEVKKDGVSVALLNPGPVATDMMKNAPIALRPVDDAAARLVGLIDRLTLENTGRFWDVTGVELPW
jgi:NAD(P)-dependent dehydrogenase (short-subunit alcohol dehydrogenase family)